MSLLNLSSNILRRTFNNRIFNFMMLIFIFFKFFYYLCLSFLNFFPDSLMDSTALFLSPLYFAVLSFYPTNWDSKISRHKHIVIVFIKRNSIGYILLIANFFIWSIWRYGSLILTFYWLHMETFIFYLLSDDCEFKIAWIDAKGNANQ